MIRKLFFTFAMLYLSLFVFAHYVAYMGLKGPGPSFGYIYPIGLGLPWSLFGGAFCMGVFGTPEKSLQIFFILTCVIPGCINFLILLVPVFWRSRTNDPYAALDQ